MYRWRGKTAIVTGAASGIGAAITRELLSAGINVVGLDIQNKEAECVKQDGTSGTLYAVHCDVANEEDLKKAFLWVEEHLDGVQILVNNAGVTNYSKIIESDSGAFERLLTINVFAVALCINLAVRSMKNRKVEGHIFNVNSMLGHVIPEGGFSKEEGINSWNLYPATKHATVAMTKSVNRELKDSKLPIRITSISPGIVKTNIVDKAPILKEIMFNNLPYILPEDVADGVMYALGKRPDVQISELSIEAIRVSNDDEKNKII